MTKNQKEELIRLIAYIGSPSEVKSIFDEQYPSRPVSLRTIDRVKSDPRFEPVIANLREKFAQKLVSQSYLANKRVRVEKLTDIYELAMSEGFFGLAKSTIESIREEVEPKQGNISFNQFNQYNQNNEYVSLTLDDIRKKKHEVLEKLEKAKAIQMEAESDDLASVKVSDTIKSRGGSNGKKK